jgi:sarcosine oxidase subunit beta
VNIRLSLVSTPMITGFEEEHGIPVAVSQDGYLFLVRDQQMWETFRQGIGLQWSLGVPVDTLTGDEAATLVPGLAVADVVAAAYCPIDGIADPGELTQGYATIAARAGARFLYDTDVRSILTEGRRVTGVGTADGRIATPAVVLATGAWSAPLAATAGVRLPIQPVPRTIVTTGPFPGVPERRTLVIDAASTLYFHREGDGVLMGMGGADAVGFDTTVDQAWVADVLLPRAVEVFPPLLEAAVGSTWAGLYEMTPDRHPVVGPVAEGLWVGAGFSGHGFQHGPVVGKLLAEMVTTGKARSLDVSVLSLERFATRGLPAEAHVV